MVWLAMGLMTMTDKEMMECFLFGGRVKYHGRYYHVLEVNHLKNAYTLELEHTSKRITEVKVSEVE